MGLDSFLEILGFVGLGLGLGFFTANIISNKKWPWLSFIILLIGILAYLFRYLSTFQSYYQQYLAGVANIDTYYLGLGVLVFLAIFIQYLGDNTKFSYNGELLRFGGFYEDSNVLAYISNKNTIVQASKKFQALLKKTDVKQTELQLTAVQADGKPLMLKGIEKSIIQCEGKLNDPVHFQFVYSNNLVLEMDIIKKAVKKNNKKIGFVLLDASISNSYKMEVQKEMKRNLYIYLDLLSEPFAYYDDEDKAYIMSRTFSEYISHPDHKLPKADLRKWIHLDDVASYDNKKTEENKLNKNYYRIQTKSGYEWFEEGFGRFFGHDFMIVKKANLPSNASVSMGTYKSLIKKVTDLCEQDKEFGLVMMNMKNFSASVQGMGKDYSDIVLNKFFTTISEGSLKDQVVLFKIGNSEYVFAIEGKDYFDLVIRDLDNKASDFLTQEVIINSNHHRINCELGLVYAQDVKPFDARNIIKTGFDCLKEATDPEFLKDYSIYQPKEILQQDYNLQELGINLEKDDLSEFMDDVKK